MCTEGSCSMSPPTTLGWIQTRMPRPRGATLWKYGQRMAVWLSVRDCCYAAHGQDHPSGCVSYSRCRISVSGNPIGTHQDYLNYSPHCLYYNWNYLKGADWASAKSLWKWVGGDQGFSCGYNNEGAMSSEMDALHVALRVSVRPLGAWSLACFSSPCISPLAVLL